MLQVWPHTTLVGNQKNYLVWPEASSGPPPFDPGNYPGLIGWWIADDAVLNPAPASDVVDVPAREGTAGPLDPLGSSIVTGVWPTDASQAIRFDNTTAKVLVSTTGFGGDTDWTSFVVFCPDSDVVNNDRQYVQFIGEWALNTLTGVSYFGSFEPGFVYRQDVGIVDYFTDPAIPGPQVFCLKYRAAGMNQLEVYRNGVLLLAVPVLPAAGSTRLAVCGLELLGTIIGPGYSLDGLWKTSIHYEGSALTQAQIDEINANIVTLYCTP